MPRRGATRFVVLAACAALLAAGNAAAAGAGPVDGPELFGIPVDFYLFALTLIGVALFHHYTLQVALTGLAVISTYKILFAPFKTGAGLAGFASHMAHEWVILTNLLLLLLGFALLARHFEKTHIPALLPRFLPHDWKGAFLMLVMVFVLSSFLDNIAAAMIGGAMAHTLFRAKVHIGYLAAIVAASNAGGAGSVIGDTTTTMMWIDKVSPLAVLDAYIAATAALVVFGIPAALQQQRYSPILKHSHQHTHVDWMRAGIVFGILAAAITVNVTVNNVFSEYADYFPHLGAAIWVVIIWSVPIRRPDWELLPEALRGSIFLLALVTCASMMPVEKLPPATWVSTLGLGFLSSVFDNIPLTALALKQGGYDWGILAYAVGFGGSMIWFGSSAGVAISNLYPEARSVGRWLAGGWHIAVAYVVGFFVLLAVLGWHPTPKSGVKPLAAPTPASAPAR
jgi:Na+/H+ antiporter NhaD/arsenite permease-like protein